MKGIQRMTSNNNKLMFAAILQIFKRERDDIHEFHRYVQVKPQNTQHHKETGIRHAIHTQKKRTRERNQIDYMKIFSFD